MEPALDRMFVDYSIKKLDQLLSRIKDCVGRLQPDEIWSRGSENENAIGNLVVHLSGNVRQWIVSGVGGAPDQRMRDAEFAARGEIGTPELLERIESAVTEAVAVLRNVAGARLAEHVIIQKYDITVMEAIYHVVEHFAQHTGQIIFATKMLTGQDLGYYKHLKSAAHAEKTP
jgi:uncharacterized damage-inducible protein DinB